MESQYSFEREEARWQIVYIHIAQQWLTTLKKEDQKAQKSHPRGPLISKKQSLFSESTNREAANHGRNGKISLQLITPDPSTPEVTTRLQAPLFGIPLVVSPISRHT
jgi:hypothetical protein